MKVKSGSNRLETAKNVTMKIIADATAVAADSSVDTDSLAEDMKELICDCNESAFFLIKKRKAVTEPEWTVRNEYHIVAPDFLTEIEDERGIYTVLKGYALHGSLYEGLFGPVEWRTRERDEGSPMCQRARALLGGDDGLPLMMRRVHLNSAYMTLTCLDTDGVPIIPQIADAVMLTGMEYGDAYDTLGLLDVPIEAITEGEDDEPETESNSGGEEPPSEDADSSDGEIGVSPEEKKILSENSDAEAENEISDEGNPDVSAEDSAPEPEIENSDEENASEGEAQDSSEESSADEGKNAIPESSDSMPAENSLAGEPEFSAEENAADGEDNAVTENPSGEEFSVSEESEGKNTETEAQEGGEPEIESSSSVEAEAEDSEIEAQENAEFEIENSSDAESEANSGVEDFPSENASSEPEIEVSEEGNPDFAAETSVSEQEIENSAESEAQDSSEENPIPESSDSTPEEDALAGEPEFSAEENAAGEEEADAVTENPLGEEISVSEESENTEIEAQEGGEPEIESSAGGEAEAENSEIESQENAEPEIENSSDDEGEADSGGEDPSPENASAEPEIGGYGADVALEEAEINDASDITDVFATVSEEELAIAREHSANDNFAAEEVVRPDLRDEFEDDEDSSENSEAEILLQANFGGEPEIADSDEGSALENSASSDSAQEDSERNEIERARFAEGVFIGDPKAVLDEADFSRWQDDGRQEGFVQKDDALLMICHALPKSGSIATSQQGLSLAVESGYVAAVNLKFVRGERDALNKQGAVVPLPCVVDVACGKDGSCSFRLHRKRRRCIRCTIDLA